MPRESWLANGLATGRSRERGKAKSRAIACPAKHSSLAAGVRPATSRLRAYLLHALWEIYKTSKLTLANAEFFQADVCCSRSRLQSLRRLSLQAPGGSRAEGRAPGRRTVAERQALHGAPGPIPAQGWQSLP